MVTTSTMRNAIATKQIEAREGNDPLSIISIGPGLIDTLTSQLFMQLRSKQPTLLSTNTFGIELSDKFKTQNKFSKYMLFFLQVFLSFTSNKHGEYVLITVVDDDGRRATLHRHLNLLLERALAATHQSNVVGRQVGIYIFRTSVVVLDGRRLRRRRCRRVGRRCGLFLSTTQK